MSQHYILENTTRGTVLATDLLEATNPWTRMRGLLGRNELPPGQGLLIRPCQGVHTWFMRFPIDVLHVDRQGTVCRLLPALAPNRCGPMVWQAAYVIELPAGTAAATETRPGDRLALVSADEFAGCRRSVAPAPKGSLPGPNSPLG
jgi:uncharacterized protein